VFDGDCNSSKVGTVGTLVVSSPCLPSFVHPMHGFSVSSSRFRDLGVNYTHFVERLERSWLQVTDAYVRVMHVR
jgi:hypothetical protein